MNPDNGQVYAMGSYPTFDPTVFTKPLSESTYKALTSPNGGDPLLNRAIQSAGPDRLDLQADHRHGRPGERRLDARASSYDDTGQFCFSGTSAGTTPGSAVDGVARPGQRDPGLLGRLLLQPGRAAPTPARHAIPAAARWTSGRGPSGSAARPGSTCPASSRARCPRRAGGPRNKLEAECDSATGQFRYTNGATSAPTSTRAGTAAPSTLPGGCGIADGTNRPWSVGDNVNLAVGQGDVQVTPLQLAVAYSALANGGTIVRPHIGLDVQNPAGTVLQKIDPPPARHININPLLPGDDPGRACAPPPPSRAAPPTT